MVEEFQPDVVMTDIKMPYMDGMELSGRIKTEFPATKILLFTGYDEFEYAKEAVHLEVEEYILKPVNSIELTNVLTQVKIKLDQEISEKRNVATLEKHYMESLPLLQADFYSALIEGQLDQEEELARLCPSCRLQAEEARCPVCGRPAESWEGALNPSFDRERYERLRKGGQP